MKGAKYVPGAAEKEKLSNQNPRREPRVVDTRRHNAIPIVALIARSVERFQACH
jgi:hypothetical protein